MTRLAVSVEGQTEEAFVKGVLADHLRERQVEPTPILIGRASGRAGGGNVSVPRLASDMAKLYWNFDCVTSLVDLYGLRGKGADSAEELEGRIRDAIGAILGRNWNRTRVMPYVQRHEFESLLFSSVEAFGELVDVPDEAVDELRRVRAGFQTPEDINDNVNTAPSKRIEAAVPRYNKVVDGSGLAARIGLKEICDECPRFSEWIARLERSRTSRR